MAWNRQELTKEDLVKAGLNPDDLAELKAQGVKKADLETLKTEMTATVTDLIKAQFSELETKLKPKPVEQQTENTEKPDEMTEYITDPVAFVNKKMGQVTGYAAITNTKIRMDLALDRAKATLKGFNNPTLKEEIMAEWGQYKPESFALNKDFDPDKLILKIHNMVLGNHMDDIQRDTDKRDGKFNMIATGGNTSVGGNQSVGGPSKKPEDMLTDVEKKQAARYGMTPEEWVKQQSEMADEEQKVLANQV
jgi:hypothetical protein